MVSPNEKLSNNALNLVSQTCVVSEIRVSEFKESEPLVGRRCACFVSIYTVHVCVVDVRGLLWVVSCVPRDCSNVVEYTDHYIGPCPERNAIENENERFHRRLCVCVCVRGNAVEWETNVLFDQGFHESKSYCMRLKHI